MDTTGKIWVFYDATTKVKSQPMTVLQAHAFLLAVIDTKAKKVFLWTPGWPRWESVRNFVASNQKYFELTPNSIPDVSVTATQKQLPQPKDVLLDEETKTAIEDESTALLENMVNAVPADPMFTEILEENTQSKIRKDDGVNHNYYTEEFSIDNVDPNASNKLKINFGNKNKSPEKRQQKRHNFKIEVILISDNGMSFRSCSENISLGGTLLEDDLPKEFLNHHFELILVNKFEANPNAGRLRFPGHVVGDYLNPRRLMFGNDPDMRQRLDRMLKAYTKSLAAEKKKKKSA